MSWLLRILKILTAISFLFILIPGDKWDFRMFELIIFWIVSIIYSPLGLIAVLAELYLVFTAVKRNNKKQTHLITITILILLNCYPLIFSKEIIFAKETEYCFPARTFILLSFSTALLSLVCFFKPR